MKNKSNESTIKEYIPSDTKFKSFRLTEPIKEALEALGFDEPTPIQKEAIPIILAGKDLVGKSQTGSGKTAAFAIPLCEKVNWDERAPQALVLEPTRELAMQVRDELFIIGRKRRLKVPVILGGMPINQQINDLRQRSHIVVGTPGRIMDHVRRETINLSRIKYLVIDEADLMLDMGFIEDVEQIIESLDTKPIMVLFSATAPREKNGERGLTYLGGHLESLIEKYMQNPVRIEIESETETVDTITQEAYIIEEDGKYDLLMNLYVLENPASSIVFCATRQMVNVLFRQMKKDGISCGMLHGAMDQNIRLSTIEDFREGKFLHLITSDVSARGVDFPDVTHVFNYDFPSKKENYVHRIGRTGRNGRKGKAISLVEPDNTYMLKNMEKYTQATITILNAPDYETVEAARLNFKIEQSKKKAPKEKKGAALLEGITKLCISGGKQSKMRPGDLVGAICSVNGITADDIGIIDIRDSMSYVEILNGKGKRVYGELKDKTIKGKVRNIRFIRNIK